MYPLYIYIYIYISLLAYIYLAEAGSSKMAWRPIYAACSKSSLNCGIQKPGWKKVLQLLLNIIAKALSGSDITCLFGKCSVSAFVYFAEKMWVLRYYLRIHKIIQTQILI